MRIGSLDCGLGMEKKGWRTVELRMWKSLLEEKMEMGAVVKRWGVGGLLIGDARWRILRRDDVESELGRGGESERSGDRSLSWW